MIFMNVKCVAHHSCQVQRAVRTTENAKDIFFREAFEDAKFVILSKCGGLPLDSSFSVLVATSVLVCGARLDCIAVVRRN